MNAQTYTQVVNPVLAILATPKYNHRHQRQKQEKRTMQLKNFESLFRTACKTTDDVLLLYDPGCYGKDARPVVGNVSSFNRTL